MFSNVSTPNPVDFYTFALYQGIPNSVLESAAITGLTIDAAGNAVATSMTGTVDAGDILIGGSIPAGTSVVTWLGLSGTVSPAPLVAVPSTSANSYPAHLLFALNYALEVAIPGPGLGSGMAGYASSYLMAVYNLGLHQFLKIAPDESGSTYFAGLRQTYSLTTLRAGVVMASGDENTSQSLVVPEFFKTFTLSDLDLMKTPYGRNYLEYAQMYGPNILGVS